MHGRARRAEATRKDGAPSSAAKRRRARVAPDPNTTGKRGGGRGEFEEEDDAGVLDLSRMETWVSG